MGQRTLLTSIIRLSVVDVCKRVWLCPRQCISGKHFNISAQYLFMFLFISWLCDCCQVINNRLSCSFYPFPAIKCPEITVGEHVLVTGNRLQSSYGNVLQFSCRNKSMALYGPLHIRCEGNGQWNEEPPKCDGIIASVLVCCCLRIQIYYCSFCIFNCQSFF